MKKYDIKTTDEQTLRKWYHLMTLGRALDYLFPYYRDMLTVLSAGMTPEELILNGISKATDPGSAGRHMSNHFAKPEWHIENISSATGTHDLHAAGVGRAMVYYGHKDLSMKLSTGPATNVFRLFLYSRTTVMAFPSLKRIRLPIVKWPITSLVLRTSASFIAMERMYLSR